MWYFDNRKVDNSVSTPLEKGLSDIKYKSSRTS